MARNDKAVELMADLRGLIRTKVRGGLQTHEAQDLQMDMIRKLDNIEVELRLELKPSVTGKE